MTDFKVNDIVRIKAYDEDGINGYGRVQAVREDGLVWVVNGNMPFAGTISDFFTHDELER